ncbi:MAG: hypothetical protein CW716_08340 [Candidatus Bathyarchaeum sp.]|nr:MAG: hypothetical protein CW716_08340 [Candidatus Bathyarchaeum sp.]
MTHQQSRYVGPVLILVILVMLFQPAFVQADTSLPWLSLNGQWIVDPSGNRVAMRGAGCDFTGYSKPFLLNQYIEQIAARGYNHVRLAFSVPGWYTHHVEYEPELMDYAIDLCEQNGLYAILTCMHWWAASDVQGWDEPLPDHEQEWINCWVDIATRYKDRSAVFAYELYNEPLGEGLTPDGKDQVQCYLDAMNAIRQVDTRHPFIVYDDHNTYYKVLETEAGLYQRTFWTPETARSDTIYTSHVWWLDVKTDMQGTASDFASAQRLAANFLGSMRYYSQWMGNVPVWAGEFGTYSYDYSHANWEYVKEVIRLSEDAGIMWTVWQMDAFNQYAPDALEHITPTPYTSSYYSASIPRAFNPKPFNILDRVVDKSQYIFDVERNRWSPVWIGLNSDGFWVDLEGPITVRVKVWEGTNPYGTLISDTVVSIPDGQERRFSGSTYTKVFAESVGTSGDPDDPPPDDPDEPDDPPPDIPDDPGTTPPPIGGGGGGVIIPIPDTTAPTWSNIATSSTHAGKPSDFTIDFADGKGLSHYIFSANITGTWVNETAVSLSGTSSSASVVKTLSSKVDQIVGYMWYVNDTSNNWANTEIQTLVTTDVEAPTVANIDVSTTVAGAACQFVSEWSDLELSGYIFSTNQTGTWTNTTWVNLWDGNATTGWVNQTLNLPNNVGFVVGWRVYVNDTSNNCGDTGIQTLTVTDVNSPILVDIDVTTPAVSTVCQIVTGWSDLELSGYIFSTNYTGIWTNSTFTDPWEGTPATGLTSDSFNLPGTVGVVVGWRVYVKDTSGNWGDTGIQTIVTLDVDSPTFSEITSSKTVANDEATFNVGISDNVGLSHYIFSWNNTGTWTNQTATACTSNLCRFTGTLNSTVGVVISVKVYANDTSNNWAVSDQYNFVLTGHTLTLQAKDMDGTILPREVTYAITFPNATTTEFTSNTEGLTTITTCNGNHEIVTKWGDHVVNINETILVTKETTSNIDTSIARLNAYDGNYYLLMSLNETILSCPPTSNEDTLLLLDVDVDGEVDFKLDNTNWSITCEPETFSINAKQYETGDNDWNFSDNIFSFTGTDSEIREISVTWNSDGLQTGDDYPPDLNDTTNNGGYKIPLELSLVNSIIAIVILAYSDFYRKRKTA